jgi:hypothetical protein
MECRFESCVYCTIVWIELRISYLLSLKWTVPCGGTSEWVKSPVSMEAVGSTLPGSPSSCTNRNPVGRGKLSDSYLPWGSRRERIVPWYVNAGVHSSPAGSPLVVY